MFTIERIDRSQSPESAFYPGGGISLQLLAIVDPTGEIAVLVKRFNCGAVIDPGDGAGLAKVLETVVGNRALVEEWGRNARAMIETNYSRAHDIDKWREIVRPIRSQPQTAELQAGRRHRRRDDAKNRQFRLYRLTGNGQGQADVEIRALGAQPK